MFSIDISIENIHENKEKLNLLNVGYNILLNNKIKKNSAPYTSKNINNQKILGQIIHKIF